MAAISVEAPVNVQSPSQSVKDEGIQFSFEKADSVVVPESGNLARFRGLARRNRILERRGFLRVSTYPACARFKFGDGRLGEARHAADVPVGTAVIAGRRVCAGGGYSSVIA